jgi:hypothetical protein
MNINEITGTQPLPQNNRRELTPEELEILPSLVQVIFRQQPESEVELQGSAPKKEMTEEARQQFEKIKKFDFCAPFVGRDLTIEQFAQAALSFHFFNKIREKYTDPKTEGLAEKLRQFNFIMTDESQQWLLPRLDVFKDDKEVQDLASLMENYGEIKISDIDDEGLQASDILDNILKLQDGWKNWLFPLITHFEKKIKGIKLQSKISNDPHYKKFVKKSPSSEHFKQLQKTELEGMSDLLFVIKFLRKRVDISKSLGIAEFMEQSEKLFQKAGDSEKRLRSLKEKFDYFFCLIFAHIKNPPPIHVNDFFQKEFVILLSYQINLFENIIEKCGPFWNPASKSQYIELIRCINHNVYDYLPSDKLQAADKKQKKVIEEIKQQKNELMDAYTKELNKHFESLNFHNTDEKLHKALYENFLNLLLCDYTQRLESCTDEDPGGNAAIYSLLTSENPLSFFEHIKQEAHNKDMLKRYISGKLRLKKISDTYLELPQFEEIINHLTSELKGSNGLFENYFASLKLGYGSLFIPVLETLMERLNVGKAKQWETKYQDLSWADELSLEKPKKIACQPPKSNRAKRKKKGKKAQQVHRISTPPKEPPAQEKNTTQKVQAAARTIIEQIHAAPMQPPCQASQLRSQSAAFKADRRYYLDQLELMAELIKKASKTLLPKLAPQFINTCYLLEELSTTPEYLQRFPNESMTHGLVTMNKALGREIRDDLDKGTLWYRYPNASLSFYNSSGKEPPKGLQMIHNPSVDRSEMLKLCKEAIAYMADRMPAAKKPLDTYFNNLVNVSAGQPVASPETDDVKALTELEKKLHNIDFDNETHKIQLKEFLYHLDQLKVALQLIEAFPDKRYFTIHQRNLTYTGQYLVETAGVLLSSLKGNEVRTHNLRVYVEQLSLNLDKALSEQSRDLIKELNTRKGIDYPNLTFWSTESRKIPPMMRQLSRAYHASWIAKHHGEGFQSQNSKFSLDAIRKLAKREAQLAKELCAAVDESSLFIYFH